MKLRILSLLGIVLLSAASSYAQGTWQALTNPALNYNDGVMLLLTDGRVMVKTSSGGADQYGVEWNLLTPDINGSYVNGTWIGSGEMNYTRLYFSTQVLKDGRVYAAGGEYGTGRANAEIYNPLSDTWTSAAPLTLGYDTISDANSEMLDNGNILQAIVLSGYSVSNHTYIYDPVADTYTPGTGTLGLDNESAWLKLPDNSILYVDRLTFNSERYIPSLNLWVADAPLPVQLYDAFGDETGAAFMLPDGRAFFIGSPGSTAYYTPSGTTSPGSWATGPVIPDSMGAPDAAAAMMVNGKILCAFSHVPVSDSVFLKPTTFFEFDYTSNTFTRLRTPEGRDTLYAPAFFSNMLCLPDGSILYGSQGNDQYYIYKPDGAPLAAGKPTVDSVMEVNCDTFTATGRLFNGITEGAGYGDDWQMASNYPMVRLSRNDSVYYATVFNWTSTGVMRGSRPDSTGFALPFGMPPGIYSLQVVANGNASDPVQFSTCIVSGVKQVTAAGNSLDVYPNPAADMATVRFATTAGGAYDLKVLDILGRVVREKKGVAAAGDNALELQLDGVKRGLYTIVLQGATGVAATKLIVE